MAKIKDVIDKMGIEWRNAIDKTLKAEQILNRKYHHPTPRDEAHYDFGYWQGRANGFRETLELISKL